MWGTRSEERTGLSFKITADTRQCSHIYCGQNQYCTSSVFTVLHVSCQESGSLWTPVIYIMSITSPFPAEE
jgi:hypothetical protein